MWKKKYNKKTLTNIINNRLKKTIKKNLMFKNIIFLNEIWNFSYSNDEEHEARKYVWRRKWKKIYILKINKGIEILFKKREKNTFNQIIFSEKEKMPRYRCTLFL